MEWTPLENNSDVQKEKGKETGRQVRLEVASRRVESCGMDAMEKRRWRPKSQILINRMPGEIEGGVQKGLVLEIGRHGDV